jgi:hypothetical protein
MRIMKSIRFVQRLTVALAAAGLLTPNCGAWEATRMQSPTSTSPRIADVSLVEDGILQGQVVNGNGVAQAHVPVTVAHGNDVVATATTNQNGQFAVHGMKGGVYVVSAQGSAGVIRAWAPRTAPPSAVNGILLVPGDQAVRGQLGGFVDQYGGAALIIGGMLVAVIWVVAEHNDDAS